MSEGVPFSLTLERREGYRFDVAFDDPSWEALHTDEPAPVGDGTGPNPVRLLGAAVGNCLAASLAFCLEKSKVEVESLTARVTGTVVRNERGRWRVGALDVRLEPRFTGPIPERFHRCTELFEDFCIVTESVRSGLEVNVDVRPESASQPGGTRAHALV